MKMSPTPTVLVLYFSFWGLLISACNNKPANKAEAKESVPFDTAQSVFSYVKIPYFRSSYQINGASPWYGNIAVGSQNQTIKVGLDCGDNTNWLTSTQCSTAACTQPGRVRFDYNASTSFSWVDKNTFTKSFGPWGNMIVNTGQDVFYSPGQTNFGPVKTFLSVNYDGPSFAELDWDGGIGFPSQWADPRITSLVPQLLNKGLINPNNVCVSFHMDPVTKTGSVQIGAWNPLVVDINSRLRFPFKQYNLYNGELKYLWSTKLSGWYINGELVSKDSIYVFDTGASDFKGDTTATDAAITAINNYYNANGQYPTMDLNMGIDNDGLPGLIQLTTEQYLQQVEKGPKTGQKVIAIDTLNIDGMLLAGSVVLEDLYTVLWYKVLGTPGNYILGPKEVWLFNKKDGPVIIQNGPKGK